MSSQVIGRTKGKTVDRDPFGPSDDLVATAMRRLDAKAAAQSAAKPSVNPEEKEKWTWLDYIVVAVQASIALVIFAPLIPVYILGFILFSFFRWDEFSLTPVDRDFSRDPRLSNPRLRNYG